MDPHSTQSLGSRRVHYTSIKEKPLISRLHPIIPSSHHLIASLNKSSYDNLLIPFEFGARSQQRAVATARRSSPCHPARQPGTSRGWRNKPLKYIQITAYKSHLSSSVHVFVGEINILLRIQFKNTIEYVQTSPRRPV